MRNLWLSWPAFLRRHLVTFGASGLVVVLISGLVFQAPSFQRTAYANTFVGPKTCFLALGDSLAYGEQANFFDDAGYIQDIFYDLVHHTNPTYPT
jgi:hypothetical protein